MTKYTAAIILKWSGVEITAVLLGFRYFYCPTTKWDWSEVTHTGNGSSTAELCRNCSNNALTLKIIDEGTKFYY